MRELLARFTASLVGRSGDLQRALLEANLEEISSLAHQLKGTAGGYGFDSISIAAANLEDVSMDLEADIASVRERTEDLIRLCTAATDR